MFINTSSSSSSEEEESHFQIALSCISDSLKAMIINKSLDQIAICFFNTVCNALLYLLIYLINPPSSLLLLYYIILLALQLQKEKKNLQDLNGVYVFHVAEEGTDYLDRPTAKLIKQFDNLHHSFSKNIGSQHGVMSGSRENPLYNAIWVAQALLRKGSAKTIDKRILLFTNQDDPFGSLKGPFKSDMTRTTLQRAKDTQDLGITIELLPLSFPDQTFDVSKFYAVCTHIFS